MRGQKLEVALEELLAEMLAKGEKISRPAVQKRLGLSSRSTLCGNRAELINKYCEKQLKQLDASNSKYHRMSSQERSQRLIDENKKLEKRIDDLTEQLQKIVVNAEKYGLSPEQILEPLAPKKR